MDRHMPMVPSLGNGSVLVQAEAVLGGPSLASMPGLHSNAPSKGLVGKTRDRLSRSSRFQPALLDSPGIDARGRPPTPHQFT
jgi:hypothetical protein